MSAPDFTEQLTAYIDGELNPDDAKALEAELAKNPQLKMLEKRLRQTVGLLKQLPAPEPSRSLRRAVLDEIEQPTFGEQVRAFFTPGRLVPVGALAAAAAITVVVMNGRRAEVPDEDQLVLAQNLEVAQNMDVLEDMDLVDLDAPDDLDVVASLHELEVPR